MKTIPSVIYIPFQTLKRHDQAQHDEDNDAFTVASSADSHSSCSMGRGSRWEGSDACGFDLPSLPQRQSTLETKINSSRPLRPLNENTAPRSGSRCGKHSTLSLDNTKLSLPPRIPPRQDSFEKPSIRSRHSRIRLLAKKASIATTRPSSSATAACDGKLAMR